MDVERVLVASAANIRKKKENRQRANLSGVDPSALSQTNICPFAWLQLEL